MNCLKTKQNELVTRLSLEQSNSETAYFVTLTYNDDSLPKDSVLVKSDLQKFVKRLRSYQDYQIGDNDLRYFAVGEYGKEDNRPHFHLVLFNLPAFDTIQALKLIERSWKFGFCYVEFVNKKNLYYITKYLTKADPRDHDVAPFVFTANDLLSPIHLLDDTFDMSQFFMEDKVTKTYVLRPNMPIKMQIDYALLFSAIVRYM